MAQTCEKCGKGRITGNSICRRGLAKKKGGVGQNITGISRRIFKPNLQKIKVVLTNGTVKHMKICAKCIKKGTVVKAH